MATSSAKESPELEGKVESDSVPTPQSHDVERKATKEPATGFSIIHQERSLSHREWKDGKKREKEQRRRDREKRKKRAEEGISYYKGVIERYQGWIREEETEKIDTQRQFNAVRTEQERRHLERRMEEKERQIQTYKQQIEFGQGEIKSREESLQQLEKEEEEEKETLENEKFLEDAMRQGFVNISEVKCLLVGPAGVGKTCLKFLLLSKPPPGTRSSTACRDRPVRVIRIGKLGEEWKEIDQTALEEMIAQSIPMLAKSLLESPPPELLHRLEQLATLSDDDTHASDSAPPTTTTPSADKQPTSKPRKWKGQKVKLNSPSGDTPPDPTEQVYSKILQHLVKQKQDKDSSSIGNLFDAHWIYFIDSGGQPAFHDLIPLFAPNTTAAIYVHRLCEALDDYPAADYYKKGKKVGPSEKAPATNMDTLKCMAQTIHTQLHEGKLPAFMTVGTHRDLEHECTEARKEKNRRIKEFLEPLFPDLVLCGDSLEPLFALNTADPKDDDFKTASHLRQAIEDSAVEKKAIPIGWYILELILTVLSKQLKCKVLTFKECLAEAAKLKFSEQALKAALSYLHDLNLVLYYPKILPNTIFSDAQVPVAILSSLVETWYQLRDAKEGKCSSKSASLRNIDWERFRDRGIITVKFLSSDEFMHHFQKGLFSPLDFLHLLQGVLAATPLNEEEFFVPAFLARLPQPELTGYLNSQPISTSFAVCFSNDCAPAAVFCCSIVHLQLHSGWEIIQIIQDPGKPLARNCMQFELPYSISIVTIIDNYRFFRVCVDVPEEEKLGEVCQSIRREIFEAIKAAAKNLQYSNSVPHIGFQCLQDDEYHRTTPHTVDIKKCFWKCPNNPRVRGKLSNSQRIWLSQENDGSSGTVKEPELKDLMEHVGSVIPAKWQEVGIQLGLEDNELEEIKSDVSSCKSCFQKVFALWKRTERSEYKWNTVCEALRSKHVNEVLLAKTIRSKFVD